MNAALIATIRSELFQLAHAGYYAYHSEFDSVRTHRSRQAVLFAENMRARHGIPAEISMEVYDLGAHNCSEVSGFGLMYSERLMICIQSVAEVYGTEEGHDEPQANNSRAVKDA